MLQSCRLAVWLVGSCYGLSVRSLQLVAEVSCLVVKRNDPDHKSARDLDPYKLVWSMSCQEDVTNQHFCTLFCDFHPDSTIFATDPGVVELVGSSGTPHKIRNSKFWRFIQEIYTHYKH